MSSAKWVGGSDGRGRERQARQLRLLLNVRAGRLSCECQFECALNATLQFESNCRAGCWLRGEGGRGEGRNSEGAHVKEIMA